MKRTVYRVLLFVTLCSPGFGQIITCIDSPQDGLKTLGEFREHPGRQALMAEYNELLEVRIQPLRDRTNIVAVFGVELGRCPEDRAKPLFAPMAIGESGLGQAGVPDQRHVEFYAIGDIGYLEAHYGSDGVWLAACIIHFRMDDTFVPFNSTADFLPRLEWDKVKFNKLKKWCNEHLPKITDLGIIEVSESRPTRIVLGTNQTCIIQTRVLNHSNDTKLWYCIDVARETSGSGEKKKPKQRSLIGQLDQSWGFLIDQPGQSVGFSIDGKFYRMTPKLISQLHIEKPCGKNPLTDDDDETNVVQIH